MENVGDMTEPGPAPVHRKKQAKFPALDSSTPVGLEQQKSVASSHRVGPPLLLFTPFPEKRGEGNPRPHSQLVCQRDCRAILDRWPLMASYVEYLANICCW